MVFDVDGWCRRVVICTDPPKEKNFLNQMSGVCSSNRTYCLGELNIWETGQKASLEVSFVP